MAVYLFGVCLSAVLFVIYFSVRRLDFTNISSLGGNLSKNYHEILKVSGMNLMYTSVNMCVCVCVCVCACVRA